MEFDLAGFFTPYFVLWTVLLTTILILLYRLKKRHPALISFLGMIAALYVAVAGAFAMQDIQQWVEFGEHFERAARLAVSPTGEHVPPVSRMLPRRKLVFVAIINAFPLFVLGFGILAFIAWCSHWRLALRGY